MKWKLIVVLLALSITLGAVSIWQSRTVTDNKTRISTLSSTLEERNDRIRELEAGKQQLSDQHRELLQQAEAQATELNRQITATPPPPLTPGAAGGQPTEAKSEDGGFGKILSKMMEDPQTKEFLHQQQRLVMSQLYAPLTKRLGLTPEETAKFNELMADTAMKSASKASPLFGGAATNRTEALGALAAESKAGEEQMKEFLGEDQGTRSLRNISKRPANACNSTCTSNSLAARTWR